MLSIILSRKDFRESDQIISLYTKENGKLELLARGVKKITSKNSAHLEPFSLVDAVVEKGKEIDHLTKVQPVEFFSSIRKNMEKSLVAGYIVSLVNKLTHAGEKEERIFELLLGWLKFVESLGVFNSVLVDGFIIRLLDCLGFSPETQCCVACGVEEVEGFYLAGGGVICQACREKKEKLGERILDCNMEQVKKLELFLTGDWQLINSLKFEMGEEKRLHNLVQEYAVFHSEKKIVDYHSFDRSVR